MRRRRFSSGKLRVNITTSINGGAPLAADRVGPLRETIAFFGGTEALPNAKQEGATKRHVQLVPARMKYELKPPFRVLAYAIYHGVFKRENSGIYVYLFIQPPDKKEKKTRIRSIHRHDSSQRVTSAMDQVHI